MNEAEKQPVASRLGCVVALGLIFVPAAVALVTTGLPAEEWLVALFQGLLLASPFAFLGLSGTKYWLPWVITIGLTALFWGGFIASVVGSARSGTGVNIGMALAMFAAPFLISLAAWLSNRNQA